MDPLSQALADAVQLRRDTTEDAAVLDALRVIADECCVQLRDLQDAAVADADRAMQRLRDARRVGDQAQMMESFEQCQNAVAYAKRVSAEVVAALEGLLAGTLELTTPALVRLQRAVDITQSLIAEAERRTSSFP